MGIKKDKYQYIKYVTNYDINHYTCNDCPAKLFVEPNSIICSGLGNINANTMIIYPTYVSTDKNKFNELTHYIVDKYNEIYKSNALEALYITPVIKCFYNFNTLKLNDVVLEKCAIKTISEIVNNNSHHKIIFLGDSKNIQMQIPYSNITFIDINCPYTIFTNDNYKNEFLKELFVHI